MLVPTTCFNCESACGLLAYIDPASLQVRKFEGNPEHPGSRGRNCAKGPSTINQVTDPDRILYPLRRAGARGEGKWERITWDEALDALAARLRNALIEQRHNEIMVHLGRPGEDGYTERVLASWGVDGHNSHTNVCSSGGAHRLPVLDGHRPAQPGPRQREGHLPDQCPPRNGPLLQPARPADHRGPGERGQGHRAGHPAVQHRHPRRLLAVPAARQRGRDQPGHRQPPDPDRPLRPGIRPPVVELGGIPHRMPPWPAGDLRGVRGDPRRAVRRLHVRVRRGGVRDRRRGAGGSRRGGRRRQGPASPATRGARRPRATSGAGRSPGPCS